jgi:MFS family permease
MLGLALAYGTVMVFVPLAMRDHGISNGWLFFTMYSAGIILTRLATRRALDRGHRLHWAFGGAVFIVAGLALLSVAAQWWMFGAAAVVFGIGVGTGHPSLMAYILEVVPPARRAGATAMATSAFDAGTAGGAAVAGMIAEHLSFSSAFLTMAAVFALCLGPLALKRTRPRG